MKQNILAIFLVLLMPGLNIAAAQENAAVRQSLDKGIAFLRSAQQKTGAWSVSPRSGIGPTTIIVAGLLDAGVKFDDPMIQAALQYLEANVREDGGVYTVNGFFQNYETCCAVMCFAKANVLNPKKPYTELLAKSEKYIRRQQYTEERNTKQADVNYGGVGYGTETRPDLSNTQFFLDALKSTGADKDDPAIQKALVFVSRCQNLESEHNTMPFIAENSKNGGKNLDGGFIYVNQPESGGEGRSMRGGRGNEGNERGKANADSEDSPFVSYGSMTYAGLKSMIYAGLTKDDQRVKAAYNWICKHYTVSENPGKGAAGLYYYYQTMSKALSVLNEVEIADIDGKKHNWRADLSQEILSTQQKDGSWVNTGSRQYLENDANLVTGYVLLVLTSIKEGGGNDNK